MSKNILIIGNDSKKLQLGQDYNLLARILSKEHTVTQATTIDDALEQMKQPYNVIIAGYLYEEYDFPEKYDKLSDIDKARMFLFHNFLKSDPSPSLEKVIIYSHTLGREPLHSLAILDGVVIIEQPESPRRTIEEIRALEKEPFFY